MSPGRTVLLASSLARPLPHFVGPGLGFDRLDSTGLELLDSLKKMSRLPWDDAYKTYEALRGECDLLLEETRLEKQSK